MNTELINLERDVQFIEGLVANHGPNIEQHQQFQQWLDNTVSSIFRELT